MKHVPFDSLTLAAVVHSLQDLCGGRIRHVGQPGEYEIVLTVYAASRGGEVRWLLDCSTQWARTHLITRRLPNPPQPPTFCMTLRKYIEGGVVLAVEQRRFDRILDVRVRGLEGQTYLLSMELMGRHSNIILVSPEEQVLHAAKLISSRVNRVREVLPGRDYLPPPAVQRPDPRKVSRDAFESWLHADAPPDFATWLRTRFEGISPFLAQEIAAGSQEDQDRWEAFDAVFKVARENTWRPVFITDGEKAVGAYPVPLQILAASQQATRPDIHGALEEYYSQSVPRAALEQGRSTLTGALQKALATRVHSLRQVTQGVEEKSRAEQYRQWGELILAYLHQITKGQESVELPDYFSETGATLTIPLDPTLTPQENAERYFRRARHVAENAANLKQLQEKLTGEKDALEKLLIQVGQVTETAELERLHERGTAQGWLQSTAAPGGTNASQPRPEFEGKRIRIHTSPEGWQVLVGENAEANDYLVQRVAGSNDWWLHVRAGTSAHVVIRTQNAPHRIPPGTLRFAAELAAAHSASKNAGMVAVDYTLRKYVRRPRGAAPGLVTYSHEKTLHITPTRASSQARLSK